MKINFLLTQIALSFSISILLCFLISFTLFYNKTIIPFESIPLIRNIEIVLSILSIIVLLLIFIKNFDIEFKPKSI